MAVEVSYPSSDVKMTKILNYLADSTGSNPLQLPLNRGRVTHLPC
jgi:hypothetical protein